MRTNPLPPGQYWVDVFGKNIPVANNWFKSLAPSGVHVDATQTFENDDPNAVRNWYKFTWQPATTGLLAVWDTSLGFPTVADSSIKSSEDTVQRPDLELGPIDQLSNWTNTLEQRLGGSFGTIAGFVPYALVGGAGYLLFKLFTDTSGVVRKVKRIGKRARKAIA